MYFPLLANRTRYFKETQKGVEEMCKIMEETREEGIARGIAQGRLETTVKYYRKGARQQKLHDFRCNNAGATAYGRRCSKEQKV